MSRQQHHMKGYPRHGQEANVAHSAAHFLSAQPVFLCHGERQVASASLSSATLGAMFYRDEGSWFDDDLNPCDPLTDIVARGEFGQFVLQYPDGDETILNLEADSPTEVWSLTLDTAPNGSLLVSEREVS